MIANTAAGTKVLPLQNTIPQKGRHGVPFFSFLVFFQQEIFLI